MIIVNGYRHVVPPVSTEFITSSLATSLRNDFSGEVGFGFTVGASNITVTDLGRWVVSGNSGSHNLRITDGAVNLVTASVNTAGQPVGYLYTPCTPTVLLAGVTYYLFSTEVNTGDQWYNEGVVTSTAVATILGSYYIFPGITLSTAGSYTFVPVNFKYQ